MSLGACTPPTDHPASSASNTSNETSSEAELTITDEVKTAATAIDAAGLTAVIERLASDELEGRGPASEGDRKARQIIAEEFAQAGLQPAAEDGGWEQSFEIVSITSQAPKTWAFQGSDGVESFQWWEDYIAASGVQTATASVNDAEVVFVGYGIEAPEYDWNDFKDVDLTGKVLLMLNNDPDWDPELFAGDLRLYYGRWTYKYEIAAAKGAVGAIIIHTRPSAGYPWQVVQSSWTGAQFELPAGDEPRIQVAGWLTQDAAARLVASSGHSLEDLEKSAHSRDFAPVALGLKTSLELTNTLEQAETANVLGVLPGSDAVLQNQAVIYTAHHDHLGIGEGDDQEDRIYNGARDNASGVAELVAIAKAFRALPEPPKRSILFLAVGAEEQGLLGSKHYAQNPTFAPGNIAANINFDSANIFGRTVDLPLVGKGKSSLDAIAQQAADLQGRQVVSESDPTQGSFYRSDQFNFAKIGVPALYFDEGTNFVDKESGMNAETLEAWNLSHYHQPSDELDDSWNFEGMVEDSQLGFYCGWILGNQQALPSWTPGDEFEATRKAAIAAVSP
ncbi:MAG: M28 family peptidase [Deltaproteobacteria bacterium]|nr:M28 family peptidase [Deltaproteobacteria bacterium]